MISSIKSICLVLLHLLLAGFVTSTALASTSSMTGILSVGPNGNIYIQFTTSHAKFTVGDLIMDRVPLEELTTAQADQHVLQKAAYEAYSAWEKCQEAKELFSKGKIPSVQMEWACARSNSMNALELSIGTKAILDNNLGSQIEWAAPVYEISILDFENAKKEEQHFIDLGAEPIVLGYEPPGEGEGFTPPVNTSDPTIDTGKVVLDSVPIRSTVTPVPINDNGCEHNCTDGSTGGS
jgi:hypothetical protein